MVPLFLKLELTLHNQRTFAEALAATEQKREEFQSELDRATKEGAVVEEVHWRRRVQTADVRVEQQEGHQQTGRFRIDVTLNELERVLEPIASRATPSLLAFALSR